MSNETVSDEQGIESAVVDCLIVSCVTAPLL